MAYYMVGLGIMGYTKPVNAEDIMTVYLYDTKAQQITSVPRAILVQRMSTKQVAVENLDVEKVGNAYRLKASCGSFDRYPVENKRTQEWHNVARLTVLKRIEKGYQCVNVKGVVATLPVENMYGKYELTNAKYQPNNGQVTIAGLGKGIEKVEARAKGTTKQDMTTIIQEICDSILLDHLFVEIGRMPVGYISPYIVECVSKNLAKNPVSVKAAEEKYEVSSDKLGLSEKLAFIPGGKIIKGEIIPAKGLKVVLEDNIAYDIEMQGNTLRISVSNGKDINIRKQTTINDFSTELRYCILCALVNTPVDSGANFKGVCDVNTIEKANMPKLLKMAHAETKEMVEEAYAAYSKQYEDAIHKGDMYEGLQEQDMGSYLYDDDNEIGEITIETEVAYSAADEDSSIERVTTKHTIKHTIKGNLFDYPEQRELHAEDSYIVKNAYYTPATLDSPAEGGFDLKPYEGFAEELHTYYESVYPLVLAHLMHGTV